MEGARSDHGRKTSSAHGDCRASAPATAGNLTQKDPGQDAILKIDGTGLEPELEAFMWKILKKIRVRANAEYSDYLLGLATT